MKVTSKTLVLFILISTTFQSYSQNLAYNKLNNNLKKKATVSNKTLENGSYFYLKNHRKIFVEINGNSYTEYHPNNEFIKAEINWITKNRYKLIITEIEKSGLPFKKGTELKTKVSKVRGEKYKYKSTLGKHSWTGKLFKVSEH